MCPLAVLGSQSIVVKCAATLFFRKVDFPVAWKPCETDSILSGACQYIKRPRGNISITVIVYAVQSYLVSTVLVILGDPGAVSRVAGIFVGESLL